jgi:hypothetical protein
MKTSNWMKRFAAIAGSALMGLTLTIGANAANPEQVPVEVTFIAPIAIGEDNPLQFGLLDIAMADTSTVTINTDDSYSESTANTVVGGTQAAAQVTITVSDTTGISILVDNVAAAAYYALSDWQCSYQGAADVDCDVPYPVTSSGSSSTGDTLEIGAILTKNAVAATAVSDDTTFDVTVIFQ